MDTWQLDNLDRLLAAIGMPVTDAELRTLTWIAGWDAPTIDNVISIITRLRATKKED